MTKQAMMQKIYKEIDNLPPIPENINKIRAMIEDPDSNISEISLLIKYDPSLTADLLRISNSAWYMSRTRVGTIDRAISTIGLRQLKSILLTIGAKKALSDRYEALEEIWEHSYQCAFYSQYLMKMKNLRGELENAYITGLLHDIGKLVILTLTPKLVEQMTALSEAKSVSIAQIESLAIGLNHAEIGEKIAAKWHFPSKLAVAIGHHHFPKTVKDEWIPLVYATYLANYLCHYDPTSSTVEQIDPKVLEFFEIKNSNQLEVVLNTLTQFYASVGEAQKI